MCLINTLLFLQCIDVANKESKDFLIKKTLKVYMNFEVKYYYSKRKKGCCSL